ncbi:hypothetical protein CMV_007760 [Castanea mollissima]|uniref:Uncharacterized protein n=1 Tax=Castanea mollissima TaxID=60419 RepID=A0A8J4RSZ1_9ROSI|nr:hypothetical protein CMV_007760 [Castanea mollissima]
MLAGAHPSSNYAGQACMWIDDDQDNESGQEINGKHAKTLLEIIRCGLQLQWTSVVCKEIWRTTPKVFWLDFLKSLTIVTLIGTLIKDKSSGFYK